MIIEYSNVVPPKGHSSISVAIVLAACAFFFVPTTLIVLGYLSSRPTGSLLSPLPQGVISAVPTPTSAPIIIAAPNESEASSQTAVAPESDSNLTTKTATISAQTIEQTISDSDITTSSQIYLTPRPEDKAVYAVKSKQAGQMVISVNPVSDTVRYIDYHIVSP